MENTDLCNKATNVNYLLGRTFGSLIYSYLKGGSLIIRGGGKNGENLGVTITDEWIRANEISDFELTEQEAQEIISHLEGCESPGCVEIRERYKKMHPFLSKGELPGGDLVIWTRIFNSMQPVDCVMSRNDNNVFKDAVDAMKPHLQWFLGEDRHLWSWPGQESPS